MKNFMQILLFIAGAVVVSTFILGSSDSGSDQINSSHTQEKIQEPKSNWVVREEKSDFKDTTDIFLHAKSNEKIYCGRISDDYAYLRIRCMENTTALVIATQCFLTSDLRGYGKVEYRVDNTKAKSRSFQESTSNNSLGLWNGGRSIPMIKELINGEKLITRFTPYGENQVTASFNIAGLDEAIKPLRKACSW